MPVSIPGWQSPGSDLAGVVVALAATMWLLSLALVAPAYWVDPFPAPESAFELGSKVRKGSFSGNSLLAYKQILYKLDSPVAQKGSRRLCQVSREINQAGKGKNPGRHGIPASLWLIWFSTVNVCKRVFSMKFQDFPVSELKTIRLLERRLAHNPFHRWELNASFFLPESENVLASLTLASQDMWSRRKPEEISGGGEAVTWAECSLYVIFPLWRL